MAEELSVFSVQSQSFQQVITVYVTILLYTFSAFFKNKKPSTLPSAGRVRSWNKEDALGGAELITILRCV